MGRLVNHRMPREFRTRTKSDAVAFSLMFCACPAAAFAQITYTVGPPTAGACGGLDCDYQSIQSAIDAATAGDTVTAYRRIDDATNNECYNEHLWRRSCQAVGARKGREKFPHIPVAVGVG